MSPYRFILAIEIMAESFRKYRKIKGIVINGTEIELINHADDTTLVLDGSEESLEEFPGLLDCFGKKSGLSLNSMAKNHR